MFLDALKDAFQLLISFDPETYSAIYSSLCSSLSAILCATILALPLGFCLGHYEFRLRKFCFLIVETALAFPTVALGLIIFMLLSRKGPFGEYELLFTIRGIAIGLTLLAIPIIIANIARAIEAMDKNLSLTLSALGANRWQRLWASMWEARLYIISAIVLAFGRVISEVGIATMVGGNIKWSTRTITTAITLETNKGDYAKSMALAVVLVIIALGLNLFLARLRERLKT